MTETDEINASPWHEFDKGEIEAARELYMRLGPNAHSQIVREMREQGFRSFKMRDLGQRPERKWEGLVKLGKWKEEYRRMRAETAAEIKEVGETSRPDPEPMAVSESFREWLRSVEPDFNWNWRYQTPIFSALEKMTNGKLLRLMIFIPPRHGKSELVTVRYAAWRLLRNPKLRIVIASYNQKLANRFSRKIRRLYLSGGEKENGSRGEPLVEEYDRLSRPDPSASRLLNKADEWETAEGGGVKAIGAGAGITGFGADLIIIDDPVRGRADAESENNRERVWDWYTDDVYTRLEPNGCVVLIQTRWHEDDLAGRLLQAANVDGNSSRKRLNWKVIRLPALAEEKDPIGRKQGQALCPERFSRESLMKSKEQMGSYKFNALYQQDPISSEACIFKRDWFKKIVDRAPDGLRWVRAYDLAVSTRTTADFTASFRCAIDTRTGILYIADGFRKRIEFPEQRRYIRERITEERDTRHCIESALHGQAFVQELQREVRFAGRSISGIKPDTDKTTRAHAWTSRAEAGKVALVRGPWIDDFLDEVCRFPHGRHDDQVDAVSLAVQMLARGGHGAAGF